MSNNGEVKRKRGFWSPEEDEKLLNFISTFGVPSWSSLPSQAGLERCPKSCRLRWMNHLRPELKKEPISKEEEDMIISLHKILGNRWALIAERMIGRSDNDIKNYYNGHIKKQMLKKDKDQNTPDLLSQTMVQESKSTGVVYELQSDKEMDSNSDNVKLEIKENELSLSCDCDEDFQENLDVKRLEEYVNDLFALIR